ncbi:hypothetical protein NX801_10980 [Streptomyces sp. LP05-1]|uniref:Uncharacterized protein n=1 Tax=Streptomyces pyxinae TaxID=2970734 RepID=A0ABT2CFI4_9ACTN|nr:hypothetical protein [Streptomyces sp. LP05-1]MCS0636177.1 hypothetical protein [Streptomyces sp. LP05-1]
MTTEPVPVHLPLPAVEDFAELRRCLDVGLARIDGQLALLAQRHGQIERELTELDTRVTRLEHAKWPLPAVTGLTSVGALVMAGWQAMGR